MWLIWYVSIWVANNSNYSPDIQGDMDSFFLSWESRSWVEKADQVISSWNCTVKNWNGGIYRLGKEPKSEPKLLEDGFPPYCVIEKLGN